MRLTEAQLLRRLVVGLAGLTVVVVVIELLLVQLLVRLLAVGLTVLVRLLLLLVGLTVLMQLLMRPLVGWTRMPLVVGLLLAGLAGLAELAGLVGFRNRCSRRHRLSQYRSDIPRTEVQLPTFEARQYVFAVAIGTRRPAVAPGITC